MPRSIMSGGVSSGGYNISGVVNTYADLPDPTISAGKFYFVKGPKVFGRNTRGIYFADASSWEKTTMSVKWSEDAGSWINWTNWNDWYNGAEDISAGDRVIFNDIKYVNKTGVQTTTSPNQDALNWDIDDSNIIRYYNDTGITIEPFQVLHLKSATSVAGKLHPTPELADASVWEKTQGTLSIACEPILPGEFGCSVIRATKLRGGDTSNFAPGSQLWLTDDGSGYLTTTKPVFPSSAVSFGGNYNQQSAPNGEIIVNQTTNIYDIFNDGWNGAIKESFDFRVTSDGTTVIGTLENVNPLLNLTLLMSDVAFYTLDTTTAPLTIDLVPGTDTVTVTNYVYIPMTTKVLTVSTTAFPDTEHCKVAQLEIQSATDVQAKNGARRNQNINDHIKTEDDNGHLLHAFEWIRAQNASWGKQGVEISIKEGDLPNGYLSMTSGKVRQFHLQSIPALDMPTSKVLIVNDPDEPYRETDDLGTITKFSDGTAWSDYGKIVVWLIANKSGEPDFLCVNLPRKGERDSDKAIIDEKSRADYSIPIKYQGVGILLGAFALEIANGDVTYDGVATGFQDLRGSIPNNIAGGGGGGVTTYLGLEDTDNTYVGQAGKVVRVNGAETGLEFASSTKESALFDRTFANDTVTSGDPVFKMAQTEQFNDSLDIIKVNDEKITLKAGYKYKLESFLNCTCNYNNGYVDFVIFDATNTVDLGQKGTIVLSTNGSNSGSVVQPIAFINAITDIDIEVQHRGGDDVTGYYASIVISKM